MRLFRKKPHAAIFCIAEQVGLRLTSGYGAGAEALLPRLNLRFPVKGQGRSLVSPGCSLQTDLTIHSTRCRFAARVNSGVSATQRFLAHQSGSRFGVTSGQIADPSSFVALVFSSSARTNSAVLRSALMASSRLVLRGGANNSFKPTPLRGAA